MGKCYSGKIIPHVAVLAVVALGQAGRKVLHESFYDAIRPWVVAHPGGYYGVLRSTRVVPVIFRRQISNVARVKYNN